jgi:Sulfotransferase family.
MNNDPVLVFNHIPKCYGQSLRVYFRAFMATHTDYEAGFACAEDHRRFAYDVSTLAADDLLIGHFTSSTMNLDERYPEVLSNPRFRLFTFVRDPLDRQISQYYYSFRSGRNRKGVTMEEHPLAKVLSTASNSIAGAFPCNEENCEEMLSRYFFVGVTDRVQESMRVLVERIWRIYSEAPRTRAVERMLSSLEKVRNRGLPHENRAKRDTQADAVSAEVLETFRRNNVVDYKIYQIAQRRLDADLAELGLA